MFPLFFKAKWICASFLFCPFSVVFVRKCDGSWQSISMFAHTCYYLEAILCGLRILCLFNLGLLGRTCLLHDCPFVSLGEGYRRGDLDTLCFLFYYYHSWCLYMYMIVDLKSLYISIFQFFWVPLGFVGFRCGVNRRVEDLGFVGGEIWRWRKWGWGSRFCSTTWSPNLALGHPQTSLWASDTILIFSSLWRCIFLQKVRANLIVRKVDPNLSLIVFTWIEIFTKLSAWISLWVWPEAH